MVAEAERGDPIGRREQPMVAPRAVHARRDRAPWWPVDERHLVLRPQQWGMLPAARCGEVADE